MANEFDGERSRRRYERVTGPFDGVLNAPVLVYDLNLGGCFINSPLESEEGAIVSLQINLGNEGWITLSGETMYRHQHGFAVRFVDLDSGTSDRIERTVAAMSNQWRR